MSKTPRWVIPCVGRAWAVGFPFGYLAYIGTIAPTSRPGFDIAVITQEKRFHGNNMSSIKSLHGPIDVGNEPAVHLSTPATAPMRPRRRGLELGAAVLALAVLGLATYAYQNPNEISGSRLLHLVQSLPGERTESGPGRFKNPSHALSAGVGAALAPPAPGITGIVSHQVAKGVLQDCAECPQMVVVPAGSFIMGSSSSESVGPQHRATIEYSFAVGRYPVTRDEYKEFVSESGYAAGAGWQDPGFKQTRKDPVVDESWNDAQAYVKWLSTKTPKNYRLLSEAEYEYAERAGAATAYWWGEGDDTVQACVWRIADFPRISNQPHTGCRPSGCDSRRGRVRQQFLPVRGRRG